MDKPASTIEQNDVFDTENTETSMYFDKDNQEFNFNKSVVKKPNTVIVQRRSPELKDLPPQMSEESEQPSEESFSIKKAMGTVRGENGKYYRLVIENIKGKYALTLSHDRGGILCKNKFIPKSFVQYQIMEGEDQAVVL